MPSANKTTNYGLNKWQGNEYLKRQDFVDDNEIIDAALKDNADIAANAASTAIPKNSATASDQVLVSSASGTWEVKTLSQFKTWLALTATNVSDFAATVRSTALTGLSTATNSVITATDTVLSAIGKLQSQITANLSSLQSQISTNLSSLNSHSGLTSTAHGATSSVAGSTLMTRDSSGRVQVADPSVSQDAATKNYVDKLDARINRNLINLLMIKLQTVLPTYGVDTWVNLFTDTSGINAASTYYSVSDGELKVEGAKISQLLHDGTSPFGFDGYEEIRTDVRQSFTATYTGKLKSVKLMLSKTNSPTDNIIVSLHNKSGVLLANSSTVISGTSLTTTLTEYTFNFDYSITSGTQYFIYIERSSGRSSTNWYNISYTGTSGSYSGGSAGYNNAGSWVALGEDLYFIISQYADLATVLLGPVTTSSIFNRLALAVDQSANSGSIHWYYSSNGASWTEINSFNTMLTASLSATSLWLKCTLTLDAAVRGVAWGGFAV